MSALPTPTLVLVTALAAFLVFLAHPRAHATPLPPGPKPLPIIGNVCDLKFRELWLRATKWAQTYGAVVYLQFFGQGIVFLNSVEAATELMERRSVIYSDRVAMVMCSELCGASDMVAFTHYGPMARRQRRLMSLGLGASRIRSYQPLIASSTLPFLRALLSSPQDRVAPIRQYAGGLNLHVVYGLNVKGFEDPLLMKVEEVTELLANEIAGAGLWAVDVFPFLKYLPAWMPGMSFKRKAARWKLEIEESVDLPFEEAKRQIREGTAVPSFCASLLENVGDDRKGEEHDIKWTANSMYAAAMDTTIATVQLFFLAMMQYPLVQHRAQRELDSVLGTDTVRLPTFEDRVNLPYVEAIWEEILRWAVPVPLGLPHRLMEDDVYCGMVIPKGTIVFANIWAMLHDPTVYHSPHDFNPDRFLDKSDESLLRRRDPRNVVFGFGRRRCPGNHLVESSIWLLLTTMLTVFDISKPLNSNGVPLEPSVVFENPVFRRNPKPFEVDIRPRSAQIHKLIYEES
ncbi:cytochrome P450 [Vararia minispora EC-137]|uniref:Cytochrome P450 n=1 Tax=Vararia minispora EC-137 TaxID=1314806 RepID=A0ACB8Q941_9AGAM|nr:cytochrome P450 [Vararia minispora EC-137]